MGPGDDTADTSVVVLPVIDESTQSDVFVEEACEVAADDKSGFVTTFQA